MKTFRGAHDEATVRTQEPMDHDLSTLLRPRDGWIVVENPPARGAEAGYGSAAINFEPFRLPREVAEEWGEDPEGLVETSLRLEFITWPVEASAGVTLPTLARRTLKFPLNPEEGYIDATMYLLHEHRMVDVTEIRFGELVDGTAVDATFVVARVDLDGTEFRDIVGLEIECRLVEHRS